CLPPGDDDRRRAGPRGESAGSDHQQPVPRAQPFVPLQRALNASLRFRSTLGAGRGRRGRTWPPGRHAGLLPAESADESQNPCDSHDGEDHHRHPEDDVRRLRPEEIRAAFAGTVPSRTVRVLPVAHASKDEPGHQQTQAEGREDPDTAIPGSAGPPRRAGRRRLARGCHRLSDSPASWMKWIAVSPKVFARKISRPAGIVGSGERAARSTMTIDSMSRWPASLLRICVTASSPRGYGGSMNTRSKICDSQASGSGRPDRYWSPSLAWTSAEWSSPSLSALARRERIEDSEESTKSTCAAPRDMASKPSPPDP